MSSLSGEVSLDFKSALAGLRDFRRELKNTTKDSTRVHLGFDDSAAKGITKLKNDLKGLQKFGKETKIEISAHADAKQAIDSLGVVKAELGDIGKNPRVIIHVDDKMARDSAREMSDERRAAIAQKKVEQAEIKAAREAQRAADRETAAALRAQKELGASMAREIEAGWRRGGTILNRYGDEVGTVTGLLKKLTAEEKAAQDAANRATSARKKVISEGKSARSELGDRASMAATGAGLGIIGGLGLAAKQAIDFEDSFADVRKTVAGTDAQLDQMADSLRGLSLELPKTARELDDIAANAGQLGVSRGGILEFTKTVAALSTVTKLTSDEASTDMAKLANITRMPQSEFGKLGSTIAKLGNIGASTESEMLNMALRIAGAGHQVGMTTPQILGVANALSSLGIEAEAGGSAFSRVLISISKSSAEGGKELNLFAKTAGMSASSFKELFDRDATSAVGRFVAGLGKLKKGEIFAVLDGLGLKSIRVTDTLARASGAADLFNQSIQTGNQAWKENTFLTEKANARYTTSANQIKIAQNNLQDFGITVGTTVVPAITGLLKETKPLLDDFRGLSKESQSTIVKWTAIGGVSLVLVGQLKGVIETVLLVRKVYIGLRAAQIASSAAGVDGAVAVTAANSAMSASGLRAFLALRAGGLGAMTSLGVGIAAIAVIFWGVKTAILGTRDAGVMSADQLIAKWSALGRVWVAGGDALGNLISKLNGAAAAGDRAEAGIAKIEADRKAGVHVPKSAAWLRAHGKLAPDKGDNFDGGVLPSYDVGTSYVPQDQVAEVHKGEIIIPARFASEIRKARQGPKFAPESFAPRGYLMSSRGGSAFSRESGELAPGGLSPDGLAPASVSGLMESSALRGRANELQGLIDARVLRRARAATRSMDADLTAWRIELRQVKAKIGEAKREETENSRALREREKAQGEVESAKNAVAAMRVEQADAVLLSRMSATIYARFGQNERGAERQIARLQEQFRLLRSPEIRKLQELENAGRVPRGETQTQLKTLIRGWDKKTNGEEFAAGIKAQNAALKALLEQRKTDAEQIQKAILERDLEAGNALVEDYKRRRSEAREILSGMNEAAQQSALDEGNRSVEVFKALKATLKDTSATADDLRAALGEVPDEMLQKFPNLLGIINQVKAALPNRREASLEFLATRNEDLESQKRDGFTNLRDYNERDLSDSSRLKRRGGEDIAQLQKQIAALSPEMQVKAGVELEKAKLNWAAIVGYARQFEAANHSDGIAALKRENVERGIDGFVGAVDTAFSDVLSRQKSFGASMRASLKSTLDQMAQDVVRSQLKSLLSNLFLSALGGGKYPGQGSGQIFGADAAGPPKADGSFAVGIDRVPRDMLARIHADEAILPRERAEEYRRQKSAQLAAASPSASSGGGGTVVIVNVQHTGNIITDSPDDYSRQMNHRGRGAVPQRARSEYDRAVSLSARRGRA